MPGQVRQQVAGPRGCRAELHIIVQLLCAVAACAAADLLQRAAQIAALGVVFFLASIDNQPTTR